MKKIEFVLHMETRYFGPESEQVQVAHWEPGTYIQWWVNDDLHEMVGPIGDYDPYEVMESIRNHFMLMMQMIEKTVKESFDERPNIPTQFPNFPAGTNIPEIH